MLWEWFLFKISLLSFRITLPISTIWFVPSGLSRGGVNEFLINQAQSSSLTPYWSPREHFQYLPHRLSHSAGPSIDVWSIFTKLCSQRGFAIVRSCWFTASRALYRSVIFHWPCCSCWLPVSSSFKIRRNGRSFFAARSGPGGVVSLIILDYRVRARSKGEGRVTRVKQLSSLLAASIFTFIRAECMRFGRGQPISSWLWSIPRFFNGRRGRRWQ